MRRYFADRYRWVHDLADPDFDEPQCGVFPVLRPSGSAALGQFQRVLSWYGLTEHRNGQGPRSGRADKGTDGHVNPIVSFGGEFAPWVALYGRWFGRPV